MEVRAVGCMAGCGHGPNVALDPPGVVLNHMATPARFRDAMSAVGGVNIAPKALKATELRLAGNANAREGDLQAAVVNYTEASLVGNAVRKPSLASLQRWTYIFITLHRPHTGCHTAPLTEVSCLHVASLRDYVGEERDNAVSAVSWAYLVMRCLTMQALELGVPNGRHLLYANRAGARLQLGDKRGAADDAATAAECGPPSFTTAYIRQARSGTSGSACKASNIPHVLQSASATPSRHGLAVG